MSRNPVSSRPFRQRNRATSITYVCHTRPTPREHRQMHHLLHALLAARELPLPVRLYKREAPDFVLQTGNMQIGVETTEAINPDYVRAQTHPAAQEDDAVVDPSLYKWGTQGRSKSQIRNEAARKQLSGLPWMGDSVEQEFAQSISDVVHGKHRKFLSHYAKYDSDHLLVYHNQPSPKIDIDKARVFTANILVDYWNQRGFDTVYVHKFNLVKVSYGGKCEVESQKQGRRIRAATMQRVATGQIVFSTIRATDGAIGIVPPELDGALVSGSYTVFTCDVPHDAAYLWSVLRSHELRADMQSLSPGSGRYTTYWPGVGALLVPWPTEERRREIGEGLIDLWRKEGDLAMQREHALSHLDTLGVESAESRKRWSASKAPQ